MKQYGESKVDSSLVLAIGAIIIGNYYSLFCIADHEFVCFITKKIGLIFIVSGAIVSGIAYTEITPPNYDVNIPNKTHQIMTDSKFFLVCPLLYFDIYIG